MGKPPVSGPRQGIVGDLTEVTPLCPAMSVKKHPFWASRTPSAVFGLMPLGADVSRAPAKAQLGVNRALSFILLSPGKLHTRQFVRSVLDGRGHSGRFVGRPCFGGRSGTYHVPAD